MGFFDAIGSAVSSAVDAVSDVVSDVGSAVGDAVGDVGGFIGDTFEFVGDLTGPIGDVVDGALEVLGAGSFGAMLNAGLDKLGLPDWIGDLGGGVLDFCTGNFVGAAANGLDALEDVAKACGGDEIAGFLKAGSQITGMFSGGTKVGLGKVDDFIGAATDTVETIDRAMDGVDSLLDGDLMGAGKTFLDMAGGDLGPLGALYEDLSGEAMEICQEVFPGAKGVIDVVGQALADGKLTLEDLQHVPFDQLDMEDLFPKYPGIEPVMQEFFKEGKGILESIAKGEPIDAGSLAETLIGGIGERIFEELGEGHEDIAKLKDKFDTVTQLLSQGSASPQALELLKGLMGQVASMTDEVDVRSRHGAALRA